MSQQFNNASGKARIALPSANLFLAAITTIFLITSVGTSKAVEVVSGGTTNYNTTDNIGATVSGWTNGVSAGNTNTGWNYVGQAGLYDLGAVYLGNGWVLTAAHVYPENTNVFTLSGNAYNLTGVAFTNFTYSGNAVDLTLFQISTVATNGFNLSLPALTIDSNSLNNNFSKVVMIGYGGTGQESWGYNTVTASSGYLNDLPWNSVGFETAYGTNSFPSFTNSAILVNGDSGGGDFVKVGTNWELAGINVGADASNSYFVQLGFYDSQILADMNSVPEPSTFLLLDVGLLALVVVRRKFTT